MAGLLTFSLSDAFPFCTVIFLGALQWLVVQKVWYEITAAGTVRDLHPVPY
jgi:hypothetical protein